MRQNLDDDNNFEVLLTAHERWEGSGNNPYWEHIGICKYDVDSNGLIRYSSEVLIARYGDSSGEQNNPAVEAGFILPYFNNFNEYRLLFGGTCIYDGVSTTRNMLWYVDDPATMVNSWNEEIDSLEIDETGIQRLSNPMTGFDTGTCDAAFIGGLDFLVFGNFVSGIPPSYRPCVFKQTIPTEPKRGCLTEVLQDSNNESNLIITPIRGELSIRVSINRNDGCLADLTVFDCAGRRVFSSSFNREETIRFDQPGVYFVMAEYEDSEVEWSKCVVLR